MSCCIMTRMGLRNLVCAISSGSTTTEASASSSSASASASASVSERSGSEQAEGDQETSSSSGGGHEGRAATAAEEPVSPGSGSSHHMFSCFHACAINLIAHHPVMMASSSSSMIGSQRKAQYGSPAAHATGGDHHHQHHHHHHHGTSSTGSTPSGLGPRSRSFMNGAGEHTTGDDPISPVVTCIGQVRVKQTKAAKTALESAATEGDNKGPKKQGMLQRSSLNRMPDSPRLSRWRHFLGAKATVNLTSVTQCGGSSKHDFEIDLNRFSTTCSSLVKTAPGSLEAITTQARSGSFLAKSLMLLQLDCDESSSNQSKPAATLDSTTSFCKALEVTTRAIKLDLPKVGVTVPNNKPGPNDLEPLWKRRCGSKPLTLDLQKRSHSAPPSLN